MTQFSFPWQCTASGDGGPNSLSLSMVIATNMFLNNTLANSGVVYWTRAPYANLLAPSLVGADTARIASGVGMVEGWLYTNDANVDFDINASPGNASATDKIVLQRSLVDQTVRLARISGAANSEAVLTQTATIWEAPLVDVVLDGTGQLASITDARSLALPGGTWVKIDEVLLTAADEISFSNIPPVFSHLKMIGRAVASSDQVVTIFLNEILTANYADITHAGASNGSRTETSNDPSSGMATISVAGGSIYTDGFEILIPDYSKNVGYKAVLTRSSFFDSSAKFEIWRSAGWLKETQIINSIRLSPSGTFDADTRAVLYGIV